MRPEPLQLIGKGAYSCVYKVPRPDGEWRCIKIVNLSTHSEELIAMLEHEITVLQRIQHPNIVRFHGHNYASDQSSFEIELEFCSQGSLKEIMAYKTFKEGDLWSIASQLIAALYRCHYGMNPPSSGLTGPAVRSAADETLGTRILHRDIKPANIFRDHDGTVKLGDFGLSMILEESDYASEFLGTPEYIAPEVWDNRDRRTRLYGLKADIWSLGCTLYELCEGQPPFTDDNSEFARDPLPCLRTKICQQSLPKMQRKVSRELISMIESCLRKQPDERPSTEQLLKLPYIDQIRRAEARKEEMYSVGSDNVEMEWEKERAEWRKREAEWKKKEAEWKTKEAEWEEKEAEWERLKSCAMKKYCETKEVLQWKSNELREMVTILNTVKEENQALGVKLSCLQSKNVELAKRHPLKADLSVPSENWKLGIKQEKNPENVAQVVIPLTKAVKKDTSFGVSISGQQTCDAATKTRDQASVTLRKLQEILQTLSDALHSQVAGSVEVCTSDEVWLLETAMKKLIRPTDLEIVDLQIGVTLKREKLRDKLSKHRFASGREDNSVCYCSHEIYARVVGTKQAKISLTGYLKHTAFTSR